MRSGGRDDHGGQGLAAGWLTFGCLGLLTAGIAAVGFAVWQVIHPFTPPCPLRALPLSRGASFAWSRDSKRLLVGCADGTIAVVRFPEQAVEYLRSLPGTAQQVGWDIREHPFAVIETSQQCRLLRWAPKVPMAGGGAWQQVQVAHGFLAASPDGQHVAVMPAGDTTATRLYGPSAGSTILVSEIRRSGREARLDIGSMKRGTDPRHAHLITASFRWTSPHEIRGDLLWEGAASEFGYWSHDLQTRRSRRVDTGGPTFLPAAQSRFETRNEPAAWSELRAKLRKWKVPGVPDQDPEDSVLVVRTPRGREERRIPLGRTGKGITYFGESEVSPDGYWQVIHDAEGRLRVLPLE